MSGTGTSMKKVHFEKKMNKEIEDQKVIRNLTEEWEEAREEVTPRTTKIAQIFNQTPYVYKLKAPRSATDMTRREEAREIQVNIKELLKSSRNIKNEIKAGIEDEVENLYYMVKEADDLIKAIMFDNEGNPIYNVYLPDETKDLKDAKMVIEEFHIILKENNQKIAELEKAIKENKSQQLEEAKNLKKNQEIMHKLDKIIQNHNISQTINKNIESINNNIQTNIKEIKEELETIKIKTYASVVAAPRENKPPQCTALHSIVVSSKNETETAQEILNVIKEKVQAKENGIIVENVRKAKDRKIIIGCRTEEGRNIIKEKLKSASDRLRVEEIANKRPLVVFRNVLNENTDDDICIALQTQNQRILDDLNEKDKEIKILFRKRTRNPQVGHVVARVAPLLWKKLTEVGQVHIDLQTVKVEDHSPLIQCSMCLGYGHSRGRCTQDKPKCSHCGGSHVRAKCGEWLAGTAPKCCNCSHAKLESKEHSAFSNECPIRRKWDQMARATIEYN